VIFSVEFVEQKIARRHRLALFDTCSRKTGRRRQCDRMAGKRI